mmetsp:Transcript_20323/g.19630  ORF Transcript_20323/g.19630 Transcript_20323/m.19630 type:complete len:593 (+) Transcript_20323:46-1824(+)
MKAVFALVVFHIYSITCHSKPIKEYEDCDLWVEQEQCISNPNFMWTHCHGSCMELSKNTRDECLDWAEEGECTNNPNFIQLRCPESCNRALGWSKWARQAVNLDDLPFIERINQEDCVAPVDVLSAATIMKKRLHALVLEGGAGSVKGLSMSAPTEYLGMLGIAEAYIYTMRLYGLVLAADKQKNTQEIESYSKILKAMVDVIGAGYQSDLLMRSIPNWQEYLDYIDEHMREIYGIKNEKIDCLMKNGPHMNEINYEYNKNYHKKDAKNYDLLSKNVNSATNEITSLKKLIKTDKMESLDTYKLVNGVEVPVMGLGTWQLEGEECEAAVYQAIQIGYRHLDTAEAYRNEQQVGNAMARAVREGLVLRKDLFIASKISDESNAGYDGVRRLVTHQLSLLQTEYVDLYMLHSLLPLDIMRETWRALEEMVDEGKIRVLGVSNFDTGNLYDLKQISVKHHPLVIQNKIDPYHIGKQLDNKGDNIIQYSRDNDILVVSYSIFSSYPFALVPLEDPIIKYSTVQYNKHYNTNATTAQIILRWSLQKGFSIIPRSMNVHRLQENFNALKLSPIPDELLGLLDSLQYLVQSSVSVAVGI